MQKIITKGGYEITSPIDIICLTCNRLEIIKVTIDEFHKRLKTPFRLIIVDDESIDGTAEYLEKAEKDGLVDKYISFGNSNICQAYNRGYEEVTSDMFICAQEDITVPNLEPCVIQQMIDLMEENKDAGSLSLRIERIPNLLVNEGTKDLIPARKAASAYFRLQKKFDIDKLGEKPFGDRQHDDVFWCQTCRENLKKEPYWTRNLWASHARGYCRNRGYNVVDRPWGWGPVVGSHSRNQDIARKAYPEIDELTCEPLPNQKIFK